MVMGWLRWLLICVYVPPYFFHVSPVPLTPP